MPRRQSRWSAYTRNGDAPACCHAGIYVAKSLLAPSPATRSSRLTFVINLKTAKALGITVPPALLWLADEVIE
jgi:hypothetical protein